MKNLFCVLTCVSFLVGCGQEDKPNVGQTSSSSAAPTVSTKTPVFSLAWSEYPSWSVFGVASEKGLLNGKEGELGTVEKKWNVDLVLKEADYDTCITLLANNTVSAACLTNLDSLSPSFGRNLVAVLPTSTSVGADACIVVGIDNLDQLKGKKTYGLEKSVSQYVFERNLILAGKNPKDFPFTNMDPGAASQAMQTNQANVESIMVWNPFVLQTLRSREGAKRLFDSKPIPEEIVDCVVFGKDALQQAGGDRAACAVIDAYYQMNELLNDPVSGDATLVALGAKFSSLGLDDMKVVVKETRFYANSQAAIKLFNQSEFKEVTTPKLVKFCKDHGMVEKEPSVGFNNDGAQLNFTTRYLDEYEKSISVALPVER